MTVEVAGSESVCLANEEYEQECKEPVNWWDMLFFGPPCIIVGFLPAKNQQKPVFAGHEV